MNKDQRKIIEDEVNRLLERMEKREDRIDKAVAAGDTERVKIYERNDMKDQAKLAGIDFVLGYLGYHRHWDSKTDKNILVKFD